MKSVFNRARSPHRSLILKNSRTEVCEPTSLMSKRNSQCACCRPSDSFRVNMMCSSLSTERSIRSCFERANGPIDTLSSTIQCCSPSCVTDETIGTHFGYVERSRSSGRTASIDAANSTVRETVNAIAGVSRVRTVCLGRPETAMERVVVGSRLVVRHFQLPGVHLGRRSADRPQIMMSVAPSPSMFCVCAATVSLHGHRQAQVETTSAWDLGGRQWSNPWER